MSGFQKQVNLNQAPAQAGDYCDSNPRASMVAGAGGLVAGALGVIVGCFAWVTAAGVASSKWAAGGRMGFAHREQNALITTWLAESGLTIQAGTALALMVAGSFWGKFAAGATIAHKVYAYYADGTLLSAATASAPTVEVTANTATNTTLTVTAVTGTPLAVGQPVSGDGIPAGAYIAALGTGTGGAGTYTLSAATTATATGITGTVTTAIETPFKVCSTAAAGELAKISTWG